MLATENESQTGCFPRKYVRDDSSLGQPKFVFDSKILKKLEEKYVGDDSSLGQPKFVFDSKILKKLEE